MHLRMSIYLNNLILAVLKIYSNLLNNIAQIIVKLHNTWTALLCVYEYIIILLSF